MIRVGFAGAGGIAQVHFKNVAAFEQAEIVAVCDVVPSNADLAASKYKAAAYTDVDKMLEQEQLDALFICVPPFAHGDMEEKAASRGIHLFVEKPLGLDMETTARKARVIGEAGVITGTGYCLRYLDTVQEAKTYLQDRTIAMVNGYYLTGFVATPWWRIMSKSGGQLVEQTTHTVDLMRYLAGDVTSVHANMALRVHQDVENLDIYDVGSVNCSFSSGAVGHLSTTFTQPDHRSGVEILGKGFRIQIEGSQLTIVEKDRTITRKSGLDFYKEQDHAFLTAVATGDRTEILCPYEEALKTLAVTLAANESAQSGEVVRLFSL